MKWSHWSDAWHVLNHGLPKPVVQEPLVIPEPSAFLDRVRVLMASPTWRAAEYAVAKIRPQAKLAAAGHHAQKEQATEWGLTYSREALGRKADTWELRFLIELLIGIEKGRLPRP